ncbi:MAG: hypothetical protein CMK09_19110 [Ponticaulis sp.]|nr:hypothetical protein [Ponticaulis sp.]|tara:strand:+ start:192818 stop:193198 length:381 start_codon:yes stop_codon:yes gene_type:complete
MTPIVKIFTSGAITAILLSGASLPATAEPPHCPPGHEKKGWCSNDRVRHYDHDDRRDEQRAYDQGYKDGQRDAIRYGDRYYDNYRVIRDYDRYGLTPPPQGQYYAQMDDDIVLVMAATQLIQEFIR